MTRPSQPPSRLVTKWPSRPPCRGGLTSLNHNFCLSERAIFLRGALDSSGKTGGGILTCCSSGYACLLSPRRLRDRLHLTGTKKGCDQGQCGAGAVLSGVI